MDTTLPQVSAGVETAEGAANSLRQIRDEAQIALGRIRVAASSTKKQSKTSDSIAQRVEEIASMVEQTAATMKATANTAGGMEKIAGEMNVLVRRFRY